MRIVVLSLRVILCCIPQSTSVGSATSYYDVLGLTKDAIAQDVRRQFRKLSVKMHPDKNSAANTPEGRKAYDQLQKANEWLSNDDLRQLYDLYGDWSVDGDRIRGHKFSKRHAEIQFFRDEPLIHNLRTEAEAKEIFGLRAKHAYLMMLYAPWLTSCQEATAVYRKVALSMHDKMGDDGIRLAAVNCESSLQQFCLKYGKLRNQFELPVVLLVDPTETLIDRYRGRMDADQLSEYAIASDNGIRHVQTLDEHAFNANVMNPDEPAKQLWLILFCTNSDQLCQYVKPALKRLAYSARLAAKVGLVNCRQRPTPDGYIEFEPFCVDRGIQDVPTLVAYRRGSTYDQHGEIVPLIETEGQQDVGTPMIALRAMEVVLRLSAHASSPPTNEANGEERDREDL